MIQTGNDVAIDSMFDLQQDKEYDLSEIEEQLLIDNNTLYTEAEKAIDKN